MRVDIGLPDAESKDQVAPQIYLEGLKGYPDVRCQPQIDGSLAVFRLSLSDFYECGVTRMVNQLTVRRDRLCPDPNPPSSCFLIRFVPGQEGLLP